MKKASGSTYELFHVQSNLQSEKAFQVRRRKWFLVKSSQSCLVGGQNRSGVSGCKHEETEKV